MPIKQSFKTIKIFLVMNTNLQIVSQFWYRS